MLICAAHVRDCRALREDVYRAYLTRASSGNIDNTPLIERILTLRQDKAELLGFPNFAELSMARKVRCCTGQRGIRSCSVNSLVLSKGETMSITVQCMYA